METATFAITIKAIQIFSVYFTGGLFLFLGLKNGDIAITHLAQYGLLERVTITWQHICHRKGRNQSNAILTFAALLVGIVALFSDTMINASVKPSYQNTGRTVYEYSANAYYVNSNFEYPIQNATDSDTAWAQGEVARMRPKLPGNRETTSYQMALGRNGDLVQPILPRIGSHGLYVNEAVKDAAVMTVFQVNGTDADGGMPLDWLLDHNLVGPEGDTNKGNIGRFNTYYGAFRNIETTGGSDSYAQRIVRQVVLQEVTHYVTADLSACVLDTASFSNQPFVVEKVNKVQPYCLEKYRKLVSALEGLVGQRGIQVTRQLTEHGDYEQDICMRLDSAIGTTFGNSRLDCVTLSWSVVARKMIFGDTTGRLLKVIGGNGLHTDGYQLLEGMLQLQPHGRDLIHTLRLKGDSVAVYLATTKSKLLYHGVTAWLLVVLCIMAALAAVRGIVSHMMHPVHTVSTTTLLAIAVSPDGNCAAGKVSAAPVVPWIDEQQRHVSYAPTNNPPLVWKSQVKQGMELFGDLADAIAESEF